MSKIMKVFGILYMYFGILLFSIDAMVYNSLGELPPPPVVLESLEVVTSPGVYTNVTVTMTTVDHVQVHWTIDDNVALIDVSNRTEVYELNENSTIYSTAVIPIDITFKVLRMLVTCANKSFEIDAELQVAHNMNDTYEDIRQYYMFLPHQNEVGIGSRGARFHMFVNTTGTDFTFGMLQVDMTSFTERGKQSIVKSQEAFSFMPDMISNPVRIKSFAETKDSYHADIILNTKHLDKSGGIVTVLAACANIGRSLIPRLDIKQSLILHSKTNTLPYPLNSLGFIDVGTPNDIKVKKNGNALIRCKAVGNPTPKIELLKQVGKKYSSYTVPSYNIDFPFEVTVVFQFLNVTRDLEGMFVCRASNNKTQLDKPHTISMAL